LSNRPYTAHTPFMCLPSHPSLNRSVPSVSQSHQQFPVCRAEFVDWIGQRCNHESVSQSSRRRWLHRRLACNCWLILRRHKRSVFFRVPTPRIRPRCDLYDYRCFQCRFVRIFLEQTAFLFVGPRISRLEVTLTQRHHYHWSSFADGCWLSPTIAHIWNKLPCHITSASSMLIFGWAVVLTNGI